MAPETYDYSSYQGISVVTKFMINDISHNMWRQQTIYSKSAIYGRYTAVLSGSWIKEIIILHDLYQVWFSTCGLLCLSSASCLAYSLTSKMRVIFFSDALVDSWWTTRYYNRDHALRGNKYSGSIKGGEFLSWVTTGFSRRYLLY
jgi:hypothetical protein